MPRLIIDIDNTICRTVDGDYRNAIPIKSVISKIREYKANGFEIVFFSSRNMRTYQCNIGKITANTLPVIIEWLEKNKVPYDEIYIGKPWCGHKGFYVDDRAIRPNEFAKLSYDEIKQLIGDI